jgi:hypothetical protein
VELEQSKVERKITEGSLSFPGSERIAHFPDSKFELSESDHEVTKLRLAYGIDTPDIPCTRTVLEHAILEIGKRSSSQLSPGIHLRLQVETEVSQVEQDICSLA